MECVEDIFLVVCLGPPEPGAVDQETFVFEPYGKRRCPTSVTSPIVPSVWTVRTRKLRVENVLAGLYVCPTSSCSLVDEVFDHLLMLHRFCDFPVPAIHLIRRQLICGTSSLWLTTRTLYLRQPLNTHREKTAHVLNRHGLSQKSSPHARRGREESCVSTRYT